MSIQVGGLAHHWDLSQASKLVLDSLNNQTHLKRVMGGVSKSCVRASQNMVALEAIVVLVVIPILVRDLLAVFLRNLPPQQILQVEEFMDSMDLDLNLLSYPSNSKIQDPRFQCTLEVNNFNRSFLNKWVIKSPTIVTTVGVPND